MSTPAPMEDPKPAKAAKKPAKRAKKK